MSIRAKTATNKSGEVVRVLFGCNGCDEWHGIDPSRWTWNSNLDLPTFSPSVLVRYGDDRRCHSFVRDGQIQYLGDCTHALAGQTVDLPGIEEFEARQ